MPYFGFIVAVHGGRGIEQRHEPILPDIPNLAPALFHTVKDILDMGRIDLHIPGINNVGGNLLSADGEVFTACGQHLHHQGHNIVQSISAEFITKNVMFSLRCISGIPVGMLTAVSSDAGIDGWIFD